MQLLITLSLGRLVFDSVATLGDYYLPKPPARYDPHCAIVLNQKHVLVNANGSTFGSHDGGKTWARQPWSASLLHQSVPTGENTAQSFDYGVATWYANATTTFGSSEYITWSVDPAARVFNRSAVRKGEIRFTGMPFATYEFALLAGGREGSLPHRLGLARVARHGRAHGREALRGQEEIQGEQAPRPEGREPGPGRGLGAVPPRQLWLGGGERGGV